MNSLNELANVFGSVHGHNDNDPNFSVEGERRLLEETDQLIEIGKGFSFSIRDYYDPETYNCEVCGVPIPRRPADLKEIPEIVEVDTGQCKIARYPFARGGVRAAYFGKIRFGDEKDWEDVVLKEFIIPSRRTLAAYKSQSENSTVAHYLTEQFNEWCTPEKKISVIRSRILKLRKEDTEVLFNMEEKLCGDFKKWTNNAGNVIESNTSLLNLAKWSHETTKGYIMLTDLQGVETNGEIVLTDPAVLCTDLSRFGPTNFHPAQMMLCMEAVEHCMKFGGSKRQGFFAALTRTVRAPGFSVFSDAMVVESLRHYKVGGSKNQRKALHLEIKDELTIRNDFGFYTSYVEFYPGAKTWILMQIVDFINNIKTVKIWDFVANALIKEFSLLDGNIICARFIGKKQWIILGKNSENDNSLIVCNLNSNMERVREWRAHNGLISCIEIHSHQPWILSASYDRTIKLWDWEKDFQCINNFSLENDFIHVVQINPRDTSVFATAADDKIVKIWHMNQKKPLFSLGGFLDQHMGDITCIDFHPYEPHLATGSFDTNIKIWDYEKRTCLFTLINHIERIKRVIFHHRLPIIISTSDDGSVRIWNSSTFHEEMVLNLGMGDANCVDGRKFSDKVVFGFSCGVVVSSLNNRKMRRLSQV